jgi:hypothetical protein
MRTILTMLFLLMADGLFAQSTAEADLLKISDNIFTWEVENKIDSLQDIFSEKLVVFNPAGERQTKLQYIARLRSGNFKHNAIDVEESSAVIADNTGTVTGKGLFTVTDNGRQVPLYLTYMEVFTRSVLNTKWRLLALHASVVPK